MTYPISEMDGMTAFSAAKLKALGIRTTQALLEAAQTVKGRKALSAKTGISEQRLLEWANVSDYMRILGTVKTAQRNPSAQLLQKIKRVPKRKLVRKKSDERTTQVSKHPNKITLHEEHVAPKGVLIDIFIPAKRAEDMQLMLQKAFEERWLPKYGSRGARRLFMLQSFGAVFGYWINWAMKHLKILKLFAS